MNKKEEKMAGWVQKYFDEFSEAVLFPPTRFRDYPRPGHSIEESLYYLDIKLFGGKFSQQVRKEHENMEDFMAAENAWFNRGR